jgi:hypothetical protein
MLDINSSTRDDPVCVQPDAKSNLPAVPFPGPPGSAARPSGSIMWPQGPEVQRGFLKRVVQALVRVGMCHQGALCLNAVRSAGRVMHLKRGSEVGSRHARELDGTFSVPVGAIVTVYKCTGAVSTSPPKAIPRYDSRLMVVLDG